MIPKKPAVLLIVDDDPDDRQMLIEAFEENELRPEVYAVENGEELMDYLNHRGKFLAAGSSPRPALILLDLNMPKKDGREALKEIKESSDFRNIPVVVLTTSKAEEDVYKTYHLGVNSFITKPVTFDALVAITRDLGRYWFELVQLPKPPRKSILGIKHSD